jgi:hypothetical protein
MPSGPRPSPFLRLIVVEDEDETRTTFIVGAGQVMDGLVERTEGAPALCCGRCARVLARRVDPVKYRGLGFQCGACGAESIIP